jgi:hypothetical protein
MKFHVTAEGIPRVIGSLETVRKGFKDFRGATWIRVRNVFYQVQKEIFASEGGASRSGKWKELSSPYKEWKQKKYGSKPILQGGGGMYREFTSQPGSIHEGEQEMTLGFSQPAGFHHTGTSKMPKRDPLDMTDEQKERLQEPIKLRLRQIIDNAKLNALRG